MFYTYIIQSETLGMIYIGQTADVKKRIERHNAGGSKFTKNKGPWKLLFVFDFETRTDAILLERKLKAFKNSVKVIKYCQKYCGDIGRPDF